MEKAHFRISNSFTQPASLASALLLDNMPDIQKDPNRIITVIPAIHEETKIQGGMNIWRLYTHGKTDGKVPLIFPNFEGASPQIYKIYQHVYFESLAKSLSEGNLSLVKAREAKSAMPNNAILNRFTPLLATTDKVWAPKEYAGYDNFTENTGSTFSFYRQNWQHGLEHADANLPKETVEHPHYDELMQNFFDCECDVIYPAFFFAKHYYATVENDLGKQSVDAWDLYSSEPHQIRRMASVRSEEGMRLGLDILQTGFIRNVLDENPAMTAMREFNSLHFEKVCDQPMSFLRGETKSKLMDSIILNSGLS